MSNNQWNVQKNIYSLLGSKYQYMSAFNKWHILYAIYVPKVKCKVQVRGCCISCICAIYQTCLESHKHILSWQWIAAWLPVHAVACFRYDIKMQLVTLQLRQTPTSSRFHANAHIGWTKDTHICLKLLPRWWTLNNVF